MFLIPLLSNRSDLENAKDRSDIFDLLFDSAPANIYLGLFSNGMRIGCIGTVPQKTAYQYHTRDWFVGQNIQKPEEWGNVGFMGKFKNVEDAVLKNFPWKKETSYCLNNGKVVEYTGQKLKANKHHWTYIEPIMCLISDSPAESFDHFIRVLGYHNSKGFMVRGNWRNGLALYCDGKEMAIDRWYLEFAKCTIF